ncbi:RHS repeat-associated core domain-containing protein, partial [Frankia sp. Cr2]|uniref:RHS repeat-associated core domain-containing protein n=1 Tax=Frankia sp. Cr2 TaxID=3073932 RepID=UPI002AD25B91
WQARTTLWGAGPPSSSAGGGVDCPLRFPGQYHDPETGANYNVHRYYDPETARYDSTDPLGLTPAPNPHTYVHNPLGWLDPLGLAPCPRLVQAGEDLANRVGKNRVTIGMGNRRYTIDLRGRPHFEKSINQHVDTPHVKEYELHVGPDGRGAWRGGAVREATWDDIRLVRKYLDGVGL